MNFSSDKSLIPEKLNGVSHPHPYPSGRRFSQCLPKGAYEKYQNSASHVQTWASTGSYQSANLPSGQLSTSGSVTPFIFTGSQQSHPSMDVSSPGLSHVRIVALNLMYYRFHCLFSLICIVEKQSHIFTSVIFPMVFPLIESLQLTRKRCQV